jgi:TPR repeat protein
VNYENGLNGVPVNFEKANHYYQLAAEQGNVKAVVNLGFMYLHGRKGVEKDLKVFVDREFFVSNSSGCVQVV